MARTRERDQALSLRLQGKSYSEIKQKIGISKSTLHYWLKDYPLSNEQIRALRDFNPRRIENFRNTMQKKREERLHGFYKRARKDIGVIRTRSLFLAGFFLYWAEGLKAGKSQIGLANTDPAMIRCFIRWLEILGAPKKRLHVRLHLYSDMDIGIYTQFWSKEIDIPFLQFEKPYIKASKRASISYKGRFGHGTCNIRLYDQSVTSYVLMGVRHIAEVFN